LPELAEDATVRREVAAQIDRTNARLARVEQIKRFFLLGEDWLPGGDELTPTMKLKRKPIAAKCAAEIKSPYTPADSHAP
jgi:long-chain acyl-CoA synthetase